jgi:hypothetical protein
MEIYQALLALTVLAATGVFTTIWQSRARARRLQAALDAYVAAEIARAWRRHAPPKRGTRPSSTEAARFHAH